MGSTTKMSVIRMYKIYIGSSIKVMITTSLRIYNIILDNDNISNIILCNGSFLELLYLR